LVFLATLSACDGGHDDRATKTAPLPPAALYLSGAEIQVETPEQRELLHKALDDMLSLSSEDMRQVRYGPGGKTLREILRAHLVPSTPISVTDEDFYNQASNAKVRMAIQSINSRLTTQQ
jgi:hypothetical protein